MSFGEACYCRNFSSGLEFLFDRKFYREKLGNFRRNFAGRQGILDDVNAKLQPLLCKPARKKTGGKEKEIINHP